MINLKLIITTLRVVSVFDQFLKEANTWSFNPLVTIFKSWSKRIFAFTVLANCFYNRQRTQLPDYGNRCYKYHHSYLPKAYKSLYALRAGYTIGKSTGEASLDIENIPSTPAEGPFQSRKLTFNPNDILVVFVAFILRLLTKS